MFYDSHEPFQIPLPRPLYFKLYDNIVTISGFLTNLRCFDQFPNEDRIGALKMFLQSQIRLATTLGERFGRAGGSPDERGNDEG